MKVLYTNIIRGLVKEGWKAKGGNDTNFMLLGKNGKEIKVFKKKRNFVVRYSSANIKK